MSQNFPNPFNPSTTIRYSLPERGQVRIVDMPGRKIGSPISGLGDAGIHTMTFDAANPPFGQYVAAINMSGFEDGLTFSKTIRMTLSK